MSVGSSAVWHFGRRASFLTPQSDPKPSVHPEESSTSCEVNFLWRVSLQQVPSNVRTSRNQAVVNFELVGHNNLLGTEKRYSADDRCSKNGKRTD